MTNYLCGEILAWTHLLEEDVVFLQLKQQRDIRRIITSLHLQDIPRRMLWEDLAKRWNKSEKIIIGMGASRELLDPSARTLRRGKRKKGKE